MPQAPQKRKTWLWNLLFALLAAVILGFLWLAPPISTPPMPRDKDHAPYFEGSRKEAEKHCVECHAPGLAAPLPEKHPPPNRCLFCHRRAK